MYSWLKAQGITPYSGLKLAGYQILTNWFYKLESTKRSNNFVNLCLGGLSGMFAVTICYPTDFIRRNYQVSVTARLTQILKGETVSYVSIVKKTLREKGVAGMYQGLAPTYLKIIPATAIAFFVNDFLKNKLLK